MKKVLSALLVFVMLFSVSVTAFATDSPHTQDNNYKSESEWVMITSESGDKHIFNRTSGETIVKAYTYDDAGSIVEIDLNDLLVLKNSMSYVPNQPSFESISNINSNDSKSATRDDYSSWYYDYRETRTYVGYGTPVKVTADLRGPGTISHFNATSVSHTFGGEVGMTWTIKTVIQLGASFDWHTSLSSETSNGYTFSVPSGRIGYVRFTPYLDVTVGNLYYVYVAPFVYNETDLGEVWGATPQKIAGGFANGLFELVLN